MSSERALVSEDPKKESSYLRHKSGKSGGLSKVITVAKWKSNLAKSLSKHIDGSEHLEFNCPD